MARPEVVRRIKSYSAASGIVYQYYFHQTRRARRGLVMGTEYVYMVTADRKTPFPLGIFVAGESVRRWGKRVGRELSGTEEYAVAKMRLFQAFDSDESLAGEATDLRVDETNLEALLASLDL